jgi:ribosomal 50S subunit-recycling heat shock protein
MRLDQYLKSCRVIPRRTLAKATCDAGRVRVNQVVARPGREVSAGDVVRVDLPHRVLTFRVLSVPDRAPGKAGAGELIEILENTKKDPDP